MKDVLQLYPESGQRELKGLYLGLNLHRQAGQGDVLIYANYIASLDGRIALRDDQFGEFVVPDAIANQRDWRLYQELAAQSDVMLTSARYFRQLAKGKAQALLPVGQEEAFEDLKLWREQQGLSAQPDVVVISASLDIPADALEQLHDRKVIVCTSELADASKMAELESSGMEVIVAGKKRVHGWLLKQQLIRLGYRSAYMIAGPKVHQMLIESEVLNLLFLTTHMSLLGGDEFHTILEGKSEKPLKTTLKSAYLDKNEEYPQMFAQYALHQG